MKSKDKKAITNGSGWVLKVSSIIKYSNINQKRTRDTWWMSQIGKGSRLKVEHSTNFHYQLSHIWELIMLRLSLHSNDDLWSTTKKVEFARISYLFQSRSRAGESSSLLSQMPGWRANQSYENEKLFRLSDFTWKKEGEANGKVSFVFNFSSN